jgi:hypothetical protein
MISTIAYYTLSPSYWRPHEFTKVCNRAHVRFFTYMRSNKYEAKTCCDYKIYINFSQTKMWDIALMPY